MMVRMTRLLLITNAAAGTADERAIEEGLEVLREGAEVEVVATRDEDELVTAVADRPGLPVVVAGGDGSLHALVAALDGLGRLRRLGPKANNGGCNHADAQHGRDHQKHCTRSHGFSSEPAGRIRVAR